MPRLILLVLLAAAGAGSLRAADRPNILILYADDWRYDTLGCAGNPIVKTPTIDALARSGVRFTRACVTTAICGVSRATLLTGQWMSRHGNPAFSMFKTPWEQTYPGILRSHGYWVGHVGKWHNGKFPAERYDFGRAYSGVHWMKKPDGTPIHVTQKPFCLTLAFFATHAEDNNPKQYLPQPQSMALYENDTIPAPHCATEAHFKALPPFLASEKNEGRVRWHWRFDTPEKYQSMMKNYYRMATEVDTTAGRVLDELRAQGVLENTLVIFTCDNGYFQGDRWLADKWYPYEDSIRVPLIVCDPRMPAAKKGTTNDEFVLNVDLAPTILSFAGFAAPERMQGRDFSPLYLAEKPPAWRTEFFYEHAIITNKERIPSSEAVVRKDVKYVNWPDWNYEELFNLSSDPLEERNLVTDPAQAEKLAELKRTLAAMRENAK
jgi:arylsulfatase